MPQVRRRREEYLLSWRWNDNGPAMGTWSIHLTMAFDAEDALRLFHKQMQDEYDDYSKQLVVVREITLNR